MILKEPTAIRELAALSRQRAGKVAQLSGDLQKAQALSVGAWEAPNGWAWRGEVGGLVSRLGTGSAHLGQLAASLDGLAGRIEELVRRADAAETAALAARQAADLAGLPCPLTIYPHRDSRWVGL